MTLLARGPARFDRRPNAARTRSRLALLCLALLLAGARSRVQADTGPAIVPTNPLTRWLPSPEAHAAREQARLARALEALLAELPGVERVRAVVSLPQQDLVPLDRPLPPVQATLVVRVRAGAPDAARLEALARALLPQGASVHLERSETALVPRGQAYAPVHTVPAAATRVGPFQVAAGSAGWLRATLGALLVSNALLAGLLLVKRARR